MKKILRDIINTISLPLETVFLKRELNKLSKNKEPIKQIENLPNDVLIIAPHSDDEMLGAGGLIHSESFETVFHIYIPTLNEKGADITRIKESKKAFSSVKNKVVFYFGGLEDGGLFDQRDKVFSEVLKIIKETGAKTVFAPFFTELHKDHVACSMTALELLKEKKVDKIYFFSTNHLFLPEMVNCFHPFPRNKFDKLNLLDNYESQKKINFRKIVKVEEVYSELLNIETFSEIFYCLDNRNTEKIIQLREQIESFISDMAVQDYGTISKLLGIVRFCRKNIRKIEHLFNRAI